MSENVVIIGSGPGAFMAGIYAATANLNPVIIIEKNTKISENCAFEKTISEIDFENNCERKDVNDILNVSNCKENDQSQSNDNRNNTALDACDFTGVDKIAGLTCESNAKYLDLLFEQAKRFDVRFLSNAVQEIYFGKQIKIVFENGELTSKTCIIDDSTTAKRLLHADLYKNDRVMCEDKGTSTIIPGLFVCGSAREEYKEAILFTASGCMAALDAKNYIESNKFEHE